MVEVIRTIYNELLWSWWRFGGAVVLLRIVVGVMV